MKRIIYMVFRNFFLVPILWFRLCYHAKHTEKYTEEEQYALLSKIVHYANKGGNVLIETHGKENIPAESGYMFFPNHQGLYDVLAMVAASDKPFSVVARNDLGNIQFLKQVFSCMGAYLLDREDVRQAMTVIMNVSKEVSQGRNFLIFAEGTRSKKGNIIGDFKGGSFKAATKAKCPIIPVALIDAFVPFDRNTIEKVTVQVHFMEPILYEDYKDMKTTEIAALVQNRIQSKINSQLEKRD